MKNVYVLNVKDKPYVMVSNSPDFLYAENLYFDMVGMPQEECEDNTVISKYVYDYLVSKGIDCSDINIIFYTPDDLVHLKDGEVVDRFFDIIPIKFIDCYSNGDSCESSISDVYFEVNHPIKGTTYFYPDTSNCLNPEELCNEMMKKHFIDNTCTVHMDSMVDINGNYGVVDTELKNGQFIIPAIIKEDQL